MRYIYIYISHPKIREDPRKFRFGFEARLSQLVGGFNPSKKY